MTAIKPPVEEEKVPIKRFLLKDEHPLMVKFRKVCDLMDELGIGIDVGRYSSSIHDTSKDAKVGEVMIEDIDHPDQCVSFFPPTFEYKLVYDNPEYIRYQKKKNEEYQAAQKAAEIAKKNLENEKRLAAEAEEAKRKEKREREALAELKRKYPDV